MAYCTLDELKTYLGITTDDDDVLLSSCRRRAQQTIDTYCRRTFEATADSTKYLDAVEDVVGSTLYLTGAGELCAITSITNGDATVLASTDYVTEPRNSTPYYAIRLLVSSGQTWTYTTDPEDAIAIVGRWAYSTSAPADITQACLRLSAWYYRQKDTTADADRPLLAGDGTIVMPSSMPRDVIAALSPYRKLV
jgi:hypothetical protein